ncbi:hypothetical protein EVAR_81777_1 [Eumeta japonica]|uniref:Uncharacterized protein n=1 Tax=Eumeta variegata TaxID=151549 RepID=A0A4C1UHD6_EUMVA|nr:hypothetical protein EVAR_81777_1 [Eumeta japonica]
MRAKLATGRCVWAAPARVKDCSLSKTRVVLKAIRVRASCATSAASEHDRSGKKVNDKTASERRRNRQVGKTNSARACAGRGVSRKPRPARFMYCRSHLTTIGSLSELSHFGQMTPVRGYLFFWGRSVDGEHYQDDRGRKGNSRTDHCGGGELRMHLSLNSNPWPAAPRRVRAPPRAGNTFENIYLDGSDPLLPLGERAHKRTSALVPKLHLIRAARAQRCSSQTFGQSVVRSPCVEMVNEAVGGASPGRPVEPTKTILTQMTS